MIYVLLMNFEIIEHIKKSPSTISWHLRRLKDTEIISVQYGHYNLYQLTNKEVVAEVLHKYKHGLY
jgi:DNA-binding transcriptional ArsR family regulator